MNIKYLPAFMRLSLIAIAVLLLSQQCIAQPVPFLMKSGKYQYVDAVTLQPINGNTYIVAHPFSEGLALVRTEDNQAFIREDGTEAFKAGRGEASSFRSGVSIIRNDEKMPVYASDKSGKIHRADGVISWTIAEGYAVVTGGPDLFGFIDIATFETKIPAIYQFAWPFSEGFAVVKLNGKYGFIDKRGDMRINSSFEDARSFSEGLAPVKIGSRWGFINKKGAMIIQPIYEKVTAMVNGHSFAQKGDRNWVVIDNKGQEIGSPLQYQMITQLCDGLAGVMVNNKWGFCDVNGALVIQPAYTLVSSFGNGLAMVAQKGQRFYINTKGTEFRTK